MISTIGLSDDCHTQLSSLLKGQTRFVVYKMDTDSKNLQIEVESFGSSSSTSHDDIYANLPSDECRYLFFNIEYMEGLGKRCKTFFSLWSPSNAKTRNKMIYASSAVPFKSKLGITCLSVQAGSTDAYDYESLVELCRKSFD